MPLSPPHGGKLIDLRVPESSRAQELLEGRSIPSIELSSRQLCDLELLAIGAFSPLHGFLGQADFERVCRELQLADGTIWPIPIVLAVGDDIAEHVGKDSEVALVDSSTLR